MNILKPKLKVWVNAAMNGEEYSLMFKCGMKSAVNIRDADVVVFVGGADVDPALYGEQALTRTMFSSATDKRDIMGWRCAENKFKIGICRGGQFLNVMNGGKLWQHVDKHGYNHDLTDNFTGQVVNVSSTHHQMMRPARDAVRIAEARESTFKQADGQEWKLMNNGTPLDNYMKQDWEVLFYPKTRSLCFQPHPEYGYAQATRDYFENVLWRCINNEYPKRKEVSNDDKKVG